MEKVNDWFWVLTQEDYRKRSKIQATQSNYIFH